MPLCPMLKDNFWPHYKLMCLAIEFLFVSNYILRDCYSSPRSYPPKLQQGVQLAERLVYLTIAIYHLITLDLRYPMQMDQFHKAR